MSAETSPEIREQHIATTYIDLTRHGNRFGGPMKIKLDSGQVVEFDDTQDLTPEGMETSRNFGKTYPENVTLVHPRGGDEPRHGQTGEYIMQGTDGKYGKKQMVTGDGEIIIMNKTEASPVLTSKGQVKGARMGKGTDYKSSGMSKEFLGQVKTIINDKLTEIVNKLPEDERKQVLDPQNKEIRAKLRERAQVVGLKEAMKDEATVKLAAENEAYELMHVIELSRRGVKAGNTVGIPVVGSGMFAESLYKYALVVKDKNTGQKKVGFDDIDEIGGFTKQGTALRMKLERDETKGDPGKMEDFLKDTNFTFEFTDPEKAKLFEDKEVSLDWDQVFALANKAKERFEKK